MASNYHFLDEINPDADGWRVHVRVVRLWEQHVFMRPGDVSCVVLMDSQGTRVSATVKKGLILKFKHLIVEGNVYSLSNFSLSDNNGRVQMTVHPYRINFLASTRVKELPTGFPCDLSIYSFTDYQAIIDKKVLEDNAMDVIGVLGGYTGVIDTSNDGRSTRRVGILLINERNQRLRCTLFVEHADDFLDQLSKFNDATNIIVVLQLVRFRSWQGRSGISNCFFGTKVVFSSDDVSVSEFKKRILAACREPTIPEKYSNMDPLNVHYTLGEFAPGCKRVLVNNLRDIREAKKVIIVGKILCVQKDQLWYYVGCCKCHKSVADNTLSLYSVENCKSWKCDECGETGYGFEYRYKLQIRVKDTSGSVSVTLFHREAAKLIGKSAYELYCSLPAEVEEDIFPDDLNVMIGQLHLFVLSIAEYNITNNYHVFTVASVSGQPELLANFPMELVLLKDDQQNNKVVLEDEECEVVTPPPGNYACGSGTNAKRRNLEGEDTHADMKSNVKKKLVYVKEEAP